MKMNNEKNNLTLGIDLGGTKIDIGLVDSSGIILRRELIKTNKNGPEAVVSEISNVVKKMQLPNETPLAVGIGMAGQIQAEAGVVHFAPNLGWVDFPLGSELQKQLNIPVKVTNDVRAAAWGEWLFGAGIGCSDLICLFIGTGIGAGIVCNGEMLLGSHNAAGEVGHMTLELNGPPCSCGNHGCFEALASGWAIAKRTKEVITYDSYEGKRFLDLIGGTQDDITARVVLEAYRKNSGIAIRVIDEVKAALVAGIANLANAFNPAKIILGGGVITSAPFLLDVVREGIAKRALKTTSESLEIVQPQLKGDAGVIGAAAFAVNELKRQQKNG